MPYVAYGENDALGKLINFVTFGKQLQHSLSTGEYLKDSGATLKELRELVVMALQRNYPEMTDEFVKSNISFIELFNAFGAMQANENEAQEIKKKVDEKNVEKPNVEGK